MNAEHIAVWTRLEEEIVEVEEAVDAADIDNGKAQSDVQPSSTGPVNLSKLATAL